MAESRRRESPPMVTLPVDVLFNILIRLPVNCLLRLKSVCKSWYCLITSREFANDHLRRNSLSYDRLLIFAGQDNSLYSVNLETLESPAAKIPFPSISERFSRKNIVGSCNGLLLCICDEAPNFEALLLNSSSLPCKRIPKLEVPLNCLYVNYGLGYDSRVDDYNKVVRIVHFIYDIKIGGEAMEIMLYSSRADSWKLVKQNFPVCGKSQDGALVNNNLLHWLVRSSSLNEHRIARFDVCSEEWSEVRMPDCIEWDDISGYSRRHDMVDLGLLDGCLCLLIREFGENFGGRNVWVMKEYGVKDCWVKLFDLTDRCVIGSLHIAPIAYSLDGDEILLRRDQLSKVICYNLSEKGIKTAEIHGVPDYSHVSTCIRALIPLSGHHCIGDESWPRSGRDSVY